MWGQGAVEDDGEPFEEKFERLKGELRGLFAEGRRLEKEIDDAVGGVGMSSMASQLAR